MTRNTTRSKTTSFVFLLVLCAALFLLVACNNNPYSVNYHTGDDGLTLAFTYDTPPKMVYEGSDVALAVELFNRGAADVDYRDIIFTLTGDPFYVLTTMDSSWQTGPPAPEELNKDLLHGKSPGYPEGESLVLEPTMTVKRIQGLREQPTTQLYASVCYPYESTLGTSVCVDSNSFSANRQRQVCSAETMTFRSQGGPVAITSVENLPTPIRVPAEGGRGFYDIVQPRFILHVENVGTGTVLMPPPTTREEQVAACALRVPKEKLGMVFVNATLSNLSLECSPNPLLLRDDKGYTSCTLPKEQVGAVATANYLSTFTATVGYLYRDGIAADIVIERLPETLRSEDATYAERDQTPGYVNGIPRCEYCSGGNRNDPACAGWPADVNQTALFSCTCGEKECLKKSKDGKCVFGGSWCPGTNYCCVAG